jgi:PPOX class probable F420-dependent enzyme
MTPERVLRFLMEGTRTGKLATVRSDGRPHVAPIWFVLDGDDVIFNTDESSVKGRNLARDPRVSMVVDDQEAPYGFVIIEGTAQLTNDPVDLLNWATAIGGRYMGADRAEEFGRRNGVAGEWVVRIVPTKVIAFDDTVG